MALEAEESDRKKWFERLFIYCMERLDRGQEITEKELTKSVEAWRHKENE